MRRRVAFALKVLALLMFCGPWLFAQDTRADTASAASITHFVRTTSGSTFVGRMLRERADSIWIETSGGLLALPRSALAEVRRVAPSEIHGGEYWFPNPSATRLFFAPTGRMLQKGEGYYSNTYLFLNGLYAGLGDRFTLGGSTTLIPGTAEQVGFITPKVGVYASEKLNVALGALIGFNGFSDGDAVAQYGIVYSVASYGSTDASSTVGLGWGYTGSGFSRSPQVMLGGQARVSKRTALITENYFVTSGRDHEAVVSYGVRFFGEKLSADLGFVNLASEMVFPGFPLVSFSVRF
jgi:hypothetical protein